MRVLLLLIVLMLANCATVKVIETPIVDERIGKVPNIGDQATVPVGEVLYSQFKYWSKTGYRIQSNFSVGLGLGRIAVSDGDFVAKADVEGELVYCTEKAAYIDPLTGPFKTACFVDRNNDGRFDKVKAAPGVIWFEKDVAPPLPFEKSEQIAPRGDSFKYELLYQGTSNNSLKLSYREYLNDFARPAFFQDVTYDLKTRPTTITFRTVRIEVMEADNNQLVYRVLSGF